MVYKKLKAVIVDDEPLAREDLKAVINEFSNIELTGEFNSVSESVKNISEIKPDVIFLDIKMPGETGFDLVDKIDPSIKVIFVTAYDEYAIKAFDVNAIDYLLKPVNPKRMQQAIEKLMDQEQSPNEPIGFDYEDSVFVLFNNKYNFIKIANIMAINSADDYTEIFTSDGQHGLIQKTMKEWEQRLPFKKFVRIHRSTIINLNYI